MRSMMLGWLLANSAAWAGPAKEPTFKPVPLDQITSPHKARVAEILKKPTAKCKSPVEVFPCDPHLYQWLLDHPVWVDRYWHEVGMNECTVENSADGYTCKQTDGSYCRFHQVFDAPEERIFFCEAQSSRKGLVAGVGIDLVVVHRYRFLRRPDGQYLVAQQVESYAQADGAAVRAIMKLAKMSAEKTLEQSMQDLMLYFSLMARFIQIDPNWGMDIFAKVAKPGPVNEAGELRNLLAGLKPNTEEVDRLRSVLNPELEQKAPLQR